jgi:hypothetical protein
MSENYPLFKGYLQRALETLNSKAGARTGIRRGATRGA